MSGRETFYEFSIGSDEAGVRLDRFLASKIPQFSRTHIQRLIKEGRATIDGKPIKANHKLGTGEKVYLTVPPPRSAIPQPEPIPLDIVYEDQDLLVVSKPAGLVVHPAAGNKRGTLVNALLNHCKTLSTIGGILRPGIVHRLDKNTTGLLVVAKTDAAHRNLAEQLASRTLKRTYLALVCGEVEHSVGEIDAPIGRHPHHREKMCVNRTTGKPAITHYRVVRRSEGLTLLEITLETGRTHQIRVHLRYIGHPVVGDPEYGRNRHEAFSGIPQSRSILIGKLKKAKTQLLHATRLELTHPGVGEWMVFEAPLPPLFDEIVKLL